MINGALKRRPICVLFFPPVPEARLFYLAFRAEMLLHDLVKFLGGVAPFLQPFFTALLAEDPLGPLLVGPVGEIKSPKMTAEWEEFGFLRRWRKSKMFI